MTTLYTNSPFDEIIFETSQMGPSSVFKIFKQLQR